MGKGTILLKMHDGGKLFLQEVRHVPNLKKNLISISKLGGEGYNVSFCQNWLNICKGAMIMAKSVRVGTLYVLSDDLRGCEE